MMKKSMLFLLGILSLSVRADPEKAAAELFEHHPGFPATQEELEKSIRDKAPGYKASQESKAIQELSSMFDENLDVGRKEGDSIRAELGIRVKDYELHKDRNSAEPSLLEVEGLLNKKHHYRIPKTDAIFLGHEKIQEDKSLKEELAVEQAKSKFGADFSERIVSESKEQEEKIITCREAGHGTVESCVKRLVLTAIPQEPIVKDVTAYFGKRCYNLVTFGINLKAGTISVSQCGNPGHEVLSVTNPIGEPELPEQTTIQLLSRHHFGEGGVDFRANQMNPSHANGFTASFTAFQPKTGHRHKGNRDHFRGGQYTWRVVMPRKPKLIVRWEGCEDLERKQESGACTLGESVKKGVQEARPVIGFPGLVKQDFWEDERQYLCGFGSDKNECEILAQQGCLQIDSKCVLEKAGHCLEFEQTFRCIKGGFHGSLIPSPVIKPYFLLQKKQPGFEHYGIEDFGVSMAYFNALKEMSAEMKDGLGGIGGSADNPTIFHGKCERCTIKGGKFIQDCCNLKGVLQGVLGGGCRESEKLATALLREKRCHLVQKRYCSHRIKLGLAKVCIEWKDAYCCYGSELARIIQEIAHDDGQQAELRAYNQAHGIDSGWGSGASPNCQSLSSEQISLIDFDTPFAQRHLGQLFKEFERQAETKFKAIEEKAKSSEGMEVRAKQAEDSLKRHFSTTCKDRPQSRLRKD